MREKIRNWRWWTVALRGLAALAFGILAVIAPGAAFISLVLLFGVYAFVDGALELALAPKLPGKLRIAMGIRGLVSIIAGVLAFVMPKVTGLALLMVIAAWAVVSGVLEIGMAIRVRREIEGEWLFALEGVLSVVFGVLLFIAPLAGAIVLGLWVGAYALVLGGMMIGSAFRIRRLEHQLPQPAMSVA